MSSITTLHNTTRLKVETALLDVTLISVEVTQFTQTPAISIEDDETTKQHNNNNKQRSKSDNTKATKDFDLDDYSALELPGFDLSNSTVSYGNRKFRVKMIVFKVKCHPEHAHILTNLLIQSSHKLDQEDYNELQFVPYGLAQVAGEQVYKQQFVNQNAFLQNLVIIPVNNINSDTIYSEIIPVSRKIRSIKGFELTLLSDTKGK